MDNSESDPFFPTQIEDMAGGGNGWKKLQELLASNQHIVVSGCAGCGKSRALRILLENKIGFWFRCSSDPSLREGRDRIKNAARRRSPTEGVQWIVLEHADLLLADAQAFLRRIIETSVRSTRFILEVRDLGAVTEPLLSRTVLFNIPTLMDYEIRAEILRRVPAISLGIANRLAQQSRGNVRWAILQALGGEDGYLDASLLNYSCNPDSWSTLLQIMERINQTGSSPRALLGERVSSDVWDRPGGACPWAILASTLANSPSLS